MSARLAKLRRAVFARHSNPWSAWTRWASAPLFVIPFWTRRWRHAVPLAVWAAVNPVVFPPPATTGAWSTRATLGEELWLMERSWNRGTVLQLGAGLCGAGAALAARRRRLAPVVVLTATEMALLLVFWQLMAQYYDEHSSREG